MFSYAEFREESSVLQTTTGSIYGTLLLPNVDKIFSVAILISGSGPTDRNGNQPKLQNNSLKMLANALASHGIASLRDDKRGIGQSRIENLSEKDYKAKKNILKLFTSQQKAPYFNSNTIDSFHHNFLCNKKGYSNVESYRIAESFQK